MCVCVVLQACTLPALFVFHFVRCLPPSHLPSLPSFTAHEETSVVHTLVSSRTTYPISSAPLARVVVDYSRYRKPCHHHSVLYAQCPQPPPVEGTVPRFLQPGYNPRREVKCRVHIHIIRHMCEYCCTKAPASCGEERTITYNTHSVLINLHMCYL